MSIPPILCVVGASGSGKTTLLERLIAALSAEGLKVGAVKRASADLAAGEAGKDSSRLAAAGAAPSIAAGPNGLVANSTMPAGLVELAAAFCGGCDLVLAEGFKRSPHEKIVVLSRDGDTMESEDLSSVRLSVTSRRDPPPGTIHRDDLAALSAWVRGWLQRRRRSSGDVIGAILAGGRSRRMGADKAALRVGGRAVLPELAELLGGRLGEVWAVGRVPRDIQTPQFLRWHLDLRPGCGPLGGIAAALRVADGQAVLAVACDMPRMSGDVIDLLLDRRRREAPASVLRNPATGLLEPLAAVYEPRALESIERAIEAGALSATELLESVGAHVIEVPRELAGGLCNVNTPAELQQIEGKR